VNDMNYSVQPNYPATTHALWGRLFERQQALIADRACIQFTQGLAALALNPDRIPRLDALSERLTELSGWTVHAVDGLLPAEDFFERLAHRRFPVTWWLRSPEQADYIVEPDLFHDLVGHLPMLADPAVGDFIQAYGQAVHTLAQAGESAAVQALTRLYWFTIEFGLVGPAHAPKIYGAGLLSSFQESQWCLDAPQVIRRSADLNVMMRQAYAIDVPQPLYFAIPSLAWLWQATPTVLISEARRACALKTEPVHTLND
jgi:phenylalanine-4-hydroxylase